MFACQSVTDCANNNMCNADTQFLNRFMLSAIQRTSNDKVLFMQCNLKHVVLACLVA